MNKLICSVYKVNHEHCTYYNTAGNKNTRDMKRAPALHIFHRVIKMCRVGNGQEKKISPWYMQQYNTRGISRIFSSMRNNWAFFRCNYIPNRLKCELLRDMTFKWARTLINILGIFRRRESVRRNVHRTFVRIKNDRTLKLSFSERRNLRILRFSIKKKTAHSYSPQSDN